MRAEKSIWGIIVNNLVIAATSCNIALQLATVKKCLNCKKNLDEGVRRNFCSSKCRVYYYREGGEYEYTIYGLINPTTDLYFYVGCTRQILSKRLMSHIGESINIKNNKPSKKQSEIVEILTKGEKPLIDELFKFVGTRAQSILVEQDWIKKVLKK